MKLLKLTCSLILVFSLSNCSKDFLDKAPYGVATEETFYKTVEECKGAVMQVYHRTVQLSPWQFGSRLMFSDMNSDDYENISNPGSHMNLLANMNADNEQFKWVWNYMYRGIYLANQTIANIEGSSLNQEDKDQFIAECKALRGVCFWTLTTYWGEVPIITKPLLPEEYFTQVKGSEEACWAQTEQDFIDAAAILPETYPAEEAGRVTKEAL